MFIARGRTIAFHHLHREPLPEVLRRYVESGLTGRLVVRTPGATAELELMRGRVVGLVAEAGGRALAGREALRVLQELASARDGFVEVVELSEDRVRVDMESLPQARVEHETVLEALAPRRDVTRGARESVPGAPGAKEDMQVARDPAELARNPVALLGIVLRGRRGRDMKVLSAREAAEILRDEMGMAAAGVGYARCVTGSGLGVNVVCVRGRCAAVDVEGRPADGMEEEMECEIYLAP